DLRAVVDDVAEDAGPRLARAGVALHCTVDDDLPTVRGDAFLVRQAIDNLVENAIDFAPADSTVAVTVRGDEGRVLVEVADRGPGVPEYARGRVFERFYSLARPGGGGRSSGIGLCFVAEVAGLHGGTVALADRDGGGTVARLALPAA
ncbi:MAG TPA: ATP-binding protein, partial [Xanthomonadaceae bacterium]|nr:ATP-binding protein [Xanthomonadaceae bacterium]